MLRDKSPTADLLIHVFISWEQLSGILDSERDFYILFELSENGKRRYLKRLIDQCLKSPLCRGIIFFIDKNQLLLKRLFFLRDVTLDFYQNGKSVGIWGIPACVKIDIYGPQLFTELVPAMIQENGNNYCDYLSPYHLHSSLLLSCRKCIAREKCDGLGIRSDNQTGFEYRISHQYRKIGRDNLLDSQNRSIRKSYEDFSAYVDSSDLTYADRYLYFIKNLHYGSYYSFADRFVYHCNYLPYEEYDDELDFLGSQVENKKFLETIGVLAQKHEISRIAFSRAVKDTIVRESFYLAPVIQYDHYLLHYFGISEERYSREKLYGIGIDFYDKKIISFKIYYLIQSEKLLKNHKNLVDKIGINPLMLHENTHFYILRVDLDGKILSERIDLVFDRRDLKYYDAYFSSFSLDRDILDKLHIFALAFDFEKEEIKKINLYYRNRFE